MTTKTRVQLNYKNTTPEGEEIIDYFRKKVQEERTARGLSQRQLSWEINRSNNFVTKLENGDTIPDILEIIAIAKILKKPIAYFLPPKYRDKEGASEKMLEDLEKKQRQIAEILSTPNR